MDLRKAIKQAISEGHTDVPKITARVKELGFGAASPKRIQNIAKMILDKGGTKCQ